MCHSGSDTSHGIRAIKILRLKIDAILLFIQIVDEEFFLTFRMRVGTSRRTEFICYHPKLS